MADFVAVIRRTVDGLSDNVPEMRSKVYEKARGAVRRQLENMKPRPSDELIDRQMLKLEAAISEVESDYAEALPAADDITEEAVAYEAAPVHEREPQPVAEPVAEAPAPVEPEPAVGEPAYEPSVEPVAEAEPEHIVPVSEPAAEEPAYEEPQPVQDEPEVIAEEPAPAEDIPAAAEEPATEPEPADEPHEPDVEPQPIYAEEAPAVESPVAEQPVEEAPSVEAVEPWEEQAAEVAPVEPEPVSDPADEKPATGSEWDLPEWNDPAPVAATATPEPVWTESVDIDADGKVIDLAAYMPPEPPADGEEKAPVEPSHSWEWDDSDPFQQPTAPAAESSEPAISDWSWPVDKSAAADTTTPAVPAAHWNDIDSLLDKNETADGSEPPHAAVPDPEAMAAPARPVSYRVEPKRGRSGLKLAVVGVVLLALLGGGGYGYWLNRGDVDAWVTKTIASVTASAPKSATPETDKPAAETPATTEQKPQAETSGTDAGNTKFTQRLQKDGSETDPGPAQPATGEVAQAEGKSVAAQTEAGTAPAATQTPATGTNPADGTTTTPPATETNTPAATQSNVQIPEGAQKMFLYEERLGQSAPTAIEGSVAWSLKEESPGDGAPPEPAVQAQISVPERGLTALMTLKRNTDPSLPASHVVEFVFSLPQNFEGGAIDNVQRVSMKRNEQDRGDPLIAVPAKITDDFHMIALNDYPEAVATNTELLRSRSWIDIPITYRNGRRALLTLEKGPAGTEAFTKALQAWSLAKPNTSQ